MRNMRGVELANGRTLRPIVASVAAGASVKDSVKNSVSQRREARRETRNEDGFMRVRAVGGIIYGRNCNPGRFWLREGNADGPAGIGCGGPPCILFRLRVLIQCGFRTTIFSAVMAAYRKLIVWLPTHWSKQT